MATVKLIEPSIIDVNDVKDFIISQSNNIDTNNFDFNLLNIDDNQEWIQIVTNPKNQLKKFQNIFYFLLCRTIEDNKLIGFVLIKKNINLEVNQMDSQIKFHIDFNQIDKGYDLQTMHSCINYVKNKNFDQINVVISNKNIQLNKLLLDLGSKVLRKIEKDSKTYYFHNLRLS